MATESEGKLDEVDVEVLREILDLAKTGIKAKKESKEERLHVEVVRQMLTLATSGFGLVAALAWNSLIQEIVSSYVKRNLPGGNAGVISLIIYAVVVTAIAVFVTFQLSKLLKKLS